MPDDWNATRIAVERQRLAELEQNLAEREAALRRGRETFYANLQKRPWLWRQAAIKALFPDTLPGELVGLLDPASLPVAGAEAARRQAVRLGQGRGPRPSWVRRPKRADSYAKATAQG